MQLSTDPSGQLNGGEGLGDHVHSAAVERLDPRVERGDRGQHDHRRARCSFLENTEDLETATPWHHQVEQDQVNISALQLVECDLAVLRLVDRVPKVESDLLRTLLIRVSSSTTSKTAPSHLSPFGAAARK